MTPGERLGLDDRPTWMTKAECRHLDPSLFYPGRGEPTSDAKHVCDGCPVQADCLEYALDRREKHGVWGGTTYRERARILRQRRRTRKAA